jgi:hypothetical protein
VAEIARSQAYGSVSLRSRSEDQAPGAGVDRKDESTADTSALGARAGAFGFLMFAPFRVVRCTEGIRAWSPSARGLTTHWVVSRPSMPGERMSIHYDVGVHPAADSNRFAARRRCRRLPRFLVGADSRAAG